jgi:protoheme IX farnesyltransferase
MIKSFFDLTKIGIVIFVVLAGLAGYACSYQIEQKFQWQILVLLVFGLYFLSSGSLALNQVQECDVDEKMKRTSMRPIITGKISKRAAAVISVTLLVAGFRLLYAVSAVSFILGVLTVVLYNGFYTYIWKPKWAYGAIPGAIPGALPVSIGYAVNATNVFERESLYLFLVLFLWQIPHFWVLAIRYKDDYESGGMPVLPVKVGIERTFQQIILYTFLYAAVALASPWFVQANWFYLFLVVPFVIFVLRSLYQYIKTKGTKWLGFFLWLNFSMLVFLFVPVIDRWHYLIVNTNR